MWLSLSCRDGEEEYLNNLLSEEDPAFKLAADILGCGCVAAICWAFCAFCHIDPLGELSLKYSQIGTQ